MSYQVGAFRAAESPTGIRGPSVCPAAQQEPDSSPTAVRRQQTRNEAIVQTAAPAPSDPDDPADLTSHPSSATALSGRRLAPPPPDSDHSEVPLLPLTDLTDLTELDEEIDRLGAAVPCRTYDPEVFFAETPADVEYAKALCQTCPVRRACLAGAKDRREPWGVWGGELFVQGVVVPRKRPRGRPRKKAVLA
jgi:WhiB family transcriptional regulator, redox-sensing transcriptional regulator